MCKISTNFKVIFIITMAMLVSSCDPSYKGYKYVFIEHTENFIVKNSIKVVPPFVLEYKFGYGYITVTQLIKYNYLCKSDRFGVNDYVHSEVISDERRYFIIDTRKNKTYMTAIRGDYIDMLSKLEISDLITTDNVEHSRHLKKTIESREKKAKLIIKKIGSGECSRLINGVRLD